MSDVYMWDPFKYPKTEVFIVDALNCACLFMKQEYLIPKQIYF